MKCSTDVFNHFIVLKQVYHGNESRLPLAKVNETFPTTQEDGRKNKKRSLSTLPSSSSCARGL